jgi:hypothetical protein
MNNGQEEKDWNPADLAAVTPESRVKTVEFWRSSAPPDVADLLEAQMAETKKGYWDGKGQAAKGPRRAKGSAPRKSSKDPADALTEMCMRGGRAVRKYVDNYSGDFVTPTDLAGVVSKSMGARKKSQSVLAASNEMSALVKARGKGRVKAKQFARTIGKHFGDSHEEPHRRVQRPTAARREPRSPTRTRARRSTASSSASTTSTPTSRTKSRTGTTRRRSRPTGRRSPRSASTRRARTGTSRPAATSPSRCPS